MVEMKEGRNMASARDIRINSSCPILTYTSVRYSSSFKIAHHADTFDAHAGKGNGILLHN